MDELRARGVVRTSNNPTGDLAETLFCKAFGWRQAGNSNRSIDAVDDKTGQTFQIKGRRLTAPNGSRQLSAIRELDNGGFDFVAAVLFDREYKVLRAALVPHAIILGGARFVQRTNSSKFMLRDEVWSVASVRDVTEQLKGVVI
ncbi:MAG: hypothetical protein K2W78_03435 [Xanthobacteraceae bacterium]|nr:hypothetical protein [Xanthobacteraceae bacterium]